MIIGISGKINSGKDTVGEIIQYLTMDWKETGLEKPSFEVYQKEYSGKLFYSGWQNKKFADTLKDITCMLIGCTREQLEDREFKEKELGEEWDINAEHWRVRDVVVPGGGHGMPSTWNEKEFSMGNKKYTTVYGGYASDFQDKLSYKLTPRLLLQLLGTEAGRQIIHPNIWVNALMSGYKHIPAKFKDLKVGEDILTKEWVFPNWIITDMRFPNELKAVEDRNGITIRIERINLLTEENKGSLKDVQHVSETALDNAEFDEVIENDGTIEELVKKVKEILVRREII